MRMDKSLIWNAIYMRQKKWENYIFWRNSSDPGRSHICVQYVVTFERLKGANAINVERETGLTLRSCFTWKRFLALASRCENRTGPSVCSVYRQDRVYPVNRPSILGSRHVNLVGFLNLAEKRCPFLHPCAITISRSMLNAAVWYTSDKITLLLSYDLNEA